MKEKHLRMFRRIFAGTAILAILVPVRAQVSNPSTWSDFVKGSGNSLVTDTFRTQTFSKQSTDNWEYTTSGEAAVPEGKKTLKIPAGGVVSFASFSIEKYKDVTLLFRYAGNYLVKGESLQMRYLSNDGQETATLYVPQKNDDYFNYRDYRLKKMLTSLELYADEPAANTMGGYYLVNDFSVSGSIAQYSLFSGKGNWNEAVSWSHLPPFRHRAALINGAVTVDSSVECQTASLGDGGSLTIVKNGSLAVDTLFLHGNGNRLETSDFALSVHGELSVNKNVTLYYTFPEKAQWYFLSFPFDVSLKEIDPRFQLKDDTFSGSGNYLYVQAYNGDKRTSSQKPTGNWEVLSLPASSENPLVFEKGKGYLVALDAAASDNTIAFSVGRESIPDSFGKTASIPVSILSSGNMDTGHSGWYLCGNPLPAPLQLSRIEPNPALDGNVYMYENETYKPYPIGSNYVLPPLAAFFVKATAATELAVTNGPLAANAVILKSGFSSYSKLVEPTAVEAQMARLGKRAGKSFLKGNTLYLDDLPSTGNVKVMDVAGRLLYRQFVPNGSSVLPLPLRSGLYIIIVEAEGYRTQHKCVLTQ